MGKSEIAYIVIKVVEAVAAVLKEVFHREA